ncbi:MAG TPA: N,N-dimethylformamidase beta subunit family domain-containing protein [Nitrospira sp.]|nr:N,N-dimethylformamidase beta subunit family domain-containing protein [Nitrospira sp.]
MSSFRQMNEIRLTQAALAFTVVATALLVWSTGTVMWAAFQEGERTRLCESLLFGSLAGFLVYGNLCYQIARLGRLRRMALHRSVGSRWTSSNQDRLPAVTVLVPSYKEEISVIRQTLLSAALQDYPNTRVVLLLDDPPSPKTAQDRAALWAARTLPFELQSLLSEPYRQISSEAAVFAARRCDRVAVPADECVRLSESYRCAAQWYEDQAKRSPIQSHTDAWFVEHVLTQPGEQCRQESAKWFARRKDRGNWHHTFDEIKQAYQSLAGRFRVEFDVFERKQFRNLSHEPNKAMNLNSFIGLMGQRVKPVPRKDGVDLVQTQAVKGSRLIPATPYIITLDADSLLKPEYATTLVRLMERSEYARVAVAQTPYSAFPNAPGALERTAGATTDIQYLVHQGFTEFGATFWVGANALLRKSALDDICTEQSEGEIIVRRYIQDRTVIEDTESTVDLLAKGWSLYNHPERLAYSATPPDFGSLVIQRARWANGGLIILPKLLSYLCRHVRQPRHACQVLLQVHYLTSLAFAPLSVLLLLVIPFSSDLMTPWMPLAALPYFALYARDLSAIGYRPVRDLLRVYALNLLLMPVHLTGALTSIRQAIAGTKIPFRRTPKISGRTRTSAVDLCLQLAIVMLSTTLGLYYLSKMQWISGSFALANAGLFLYGIRQFIGFTELKQDLLADAKEVWARTDMPAAAKEGHRRARTVWLSLRTATLHMLRAPSQVLWLVFIAAQLLSPSRANGAPPQGLNPIQIENLKPGTSTWLLTKPARRREIEGYASAPSVNQGQRIKLYVNTAAPSFRMAVYRMGWYGGLGAREVQAAVRYQGHRQPDPYREPETGLVECRWDRPIELAIPGATEQDRWPSGYYLAKLTAEPTGEDSYILFIVREDERPSAYLVESSVTTFQAYNNWGGKSLYDYNSTAGRAVAVSLNRPYAVSPDPEAADSAGAGPFLRGWEYNMVRWLERWGFDVSYTTNIDLHEGAAALFRHAAVLVVGHDEYWTWEMRSRLEEARDRGVHLGFFSANSGYWQVRLEPSRLSGDADRTLIAYKERATTTDPVLLDRDPNNDHFATTKWRSAPVNRPEAALIGGMYLEGTPTVDGDLILHDAPRWLLQGTEVSSGFRFHGLLGYEVDGVAQSSPAGVIKVTKSPVEQAFAASTLYQAPSGALVFNAGSMQWIWGLDDFRADPFDRPRVNPAVEQMTRNLLDRFATGSQPAMAREHQRP